jgi:hypothetical protein
MDLTVGNVDAFTEGTIQDVLDRAQAAIKAETVAELAREARSREAAEGRAVALVRGISEERGRRHLKYRGLATSFARAVRWLASGVIFVAIATGMWLATPYFPQPGPDLVGLYRSALVLCVVVVYLVSVMGLWSSISVRSVLLEFEVRLARFVEAFLIRTFEDDAEPRQARVRGADQSRDLGDSTRQ